MTQSQFTAPMLAVSSTGASGRQPVKIESLAGTHVFDLKLDGVRAMIWHDGTKIRIINRAFTDISYRYPEIVSALAGTTKLGLLDGEIIADDGRFETTLLRDQQESKSAINRLALQHPCRFVVFDAPGVAMLAWTRRRTFAEQAVAKLGCERVSITPYSEDPGFFATVAEMGMEGVIAKRKASKYQPGRRSPDWVKFKTVRRVSCIISGYSPGQGSRAHLGAIHLVMLDQDDNPVDVGRCGSGFTERQTHELKALLDAGNVLVVEIEALNLTSGRKLRHPVYKGIRTDLSPLDCTTDQLKTLPTC